MPLNTLPFPVYNDVPYYDNKDANNFLTLPVEQYIRNANNLFVPVSTTNPQPTHDEDVLAKLAEILAKQSNDPSTRFMQVAIIDYIELAISELVEIKGKDFATQTTLAAILNKIIAAPATEAKQDALNALIGEKQASPTAYTLLARLKSLEDKLSSATPGIMTYAHSAVNVGTISVQALAANPNRKYALLINNYSMPIYIKVGAPAVIDQGIRLDADGGEFSMKWGENLSMEEINAITETGTGVLLVTEGV